MRILNGRVIDPANGLDEIRNLYIKDGLIDSISPIDITDEKAASRQDQDYSDTVIDARGMWVVPGLIDMHVHFREPGYIYKETIESGSKSAAAGGFTTVCCMANCDPVTDSAEAVRNIIETAKRTSVVNVLPVGSITKGLAGEEISDIQAMADAGAVAISDDGKTVANAYIMKRAMLEAKQRGLPVLAHCEDINLVNGGVMHEGKYTGGLRGISSDSEEVIVARDIVLANSTGAKLHICHVSTKGSVRLLRGFAAKDGNITAEAAPHHFTLCDSDVKSRPNFKMNPPLRTGEDVVEIQAALRDDIISVIATDHAPHALYEKECGFDKAANGIIGLETALALGITVLLANSGNGILTSSGLISKLTCNPARILGIDKGTLTQGKSADICIIDPAEEWTADSGKFFSKAANTPFDGMRLRGKVKYTIVGGNIAYSHKSHKF